MPIAVIILMGLMLLSFVGVMTWAVITSKKKNRKVFVYCEEAAYQATTSGREYNLAGRTIREAREILDFPVDVWKVRVMGEKDELDEDFVLSKYQGIIFGRRTKNTTTVTAGTVKAYQAIQAYRTAPPMTPPTAWQAKAMLRPAGLVRSYQDIDTSDRQSRNPESAMGYVYGLRAFFFHDHDSNNYLVGGYGGKWYSPRQNGRCRPLSPQDRTVASAMKPHPVPHPAPCKCGVNMYKLYDGSMQELQEQIGVMRSNLVPRRDPGVITLARGWGRVVEHDKGYRVQKAEIILAYVAHNKKLPDAWIERDVQMYYDIKRFSAACSLALKENALVTIPESER